VGALDSLHLVNNKKNCEYLAGKNENFGQGHLFIQHILCANCVLGTVLSTQRTQ
jgi:hypothetical protein